MNFVRLSPAAKNDIDAAIDYYVVEATIEVALTFSQAWENTLALLGRHPEIGSRQFAKETEVNGLRTWPMRGFPFLVLYVVDDQGPQVMRVLHSARDIPATLQG